MVRYPVVTLSEPGWTHLNFDTSECPPAGLLLPAAADVIGSIRELYSNKAGALLCAKAGFLFSGEGAD